MGVERLVSVDTKDAAQEATGRVKWVDCPTAFVKAVVRCLSMESMDVAPLSWRAVVGALFALSAAACEGSRPVDDEPDANGIVTQGNDAAIQVPQADAGHDSGARVEPDASSAEAGLDASVSDAAPAASDAASEAGAQGGGADASSACPTPAEEKFSFFLTSHRALQREAGNRDGFGGNFGGLKGADAICQRIAESSSPCQKAKVWRAFLSTSTVDAIDRIGEGPWYDRAGRLLANTKADLLQDRPRGAHVMIANDLPNEEGVPNHNPDGTGTLDNHQTLTGSGPDGRLYKQGQAGGAGSSTSCGGEAWSVQGATCWDWTSAEPKGCPRVGHSWPRQGSGINWISVWNEGGCAPGGDLNENGGLDGTRRVGSAGGYGGFYCFAVRP